VTAFAWPEENGIRRSGQHRKKSSNCRRKWVHVRPVRFAAATNALYPLIWIVCEARIGLITDACMTFPATARKNRAWSSLFLQAGPSPRAPRHRSKGTSLLRRLAIVWSAAPSSEPERAWMPAASAEPNRNGARTRRTRSGFWMGVATLPM